MDQPGGFEVSRRNRRGLSVRIMFRVAAETSAHRGRGKHCSAIAADDLSPDSLRQRRSTRVRMLRNNAAISRRAAIASTE
jgi:hypothetical protein